MAESTMSNVGKVVDEVRTARMEAAEAATKVESAKEILQTQTALLSVQAEASTEEL